MIIVMFYAVILIVSLWVMCMQDAISRWIDEARFEEEDAPQREDEEYKWSDNIKGYKE